MTEVPENPTDNILYHARFPRASQYDHAWVLENEMGPNALWLTEFLTEAMDLRPGMRVLDLGCGKALSSVFLAREYGVEVKAVDLWISEEENTRRIEGQGLAKKVQSVHAEAHNLPFTEEEFDAIISIDAFEYFGMKVDFLSSLLRILKPGGEIGIVNAGVLDEVETLPSEWPTDFGNFRSAAWWRNHWSLARDFKVEVADDMAEGRALWLQWNRITGVTDDDWLTGSCGENLGFNRIVGRRVSQDLRE